MEINKLIHFLGKQGSKLLLSLLAVACVIVWGQRLFNKKHSHHKQDFLVANQIFERFCQGEPLSLESIEATENILKRHPELHPKYDAMLATTFFSQQKIDKGVMYAESTMNHVKETLPSFYRGYAKTSLLIADKKYNQAYEAAYHLNTQLENRKNYETLYVMNLLRLVFLADELKQDNQEMLEQLQQHSAYPSLLPLFQEGKLSLTNYLEGNSSSH